MSNEGNITSGTSSMITERDKIINTSVLTVVIFVTVIGNIIALAAFAISRELKKVTNYFIVNLCLSDLMVASISMPFWIMYVTTGWPGVENGGNVYTFWICLDIFCSTCSIMSLSMISIERYICIVYPFSHEQLVSKMNSVLAIIFVIFYSQGATWFGFYQQQHINDPKISLSIFFMSYLIPVIIKVYSYSRIYAEARSQQKKIQKLEHIQGYFVRSEELASNEEVPSFEVCSDSHAMNKDQSNDDSSLHKGSCNKNYKGSSVNEVTCWSFLTMPKGSRGRNTFDRRKESDTKRDFLRYCAEKDGLSKENNCSRSTSLAIEMLPINMTECSFNNSDTGRQKSGRKTHNADTIREWSFRRKNYTRQTRFFLRRKKGQIDGKSIAINNCRSSVHSHKNDNRKSIRDIESPFSPLPSRGASRSHYSFASGSMTTNRSFNEFKARSLQRFRQFRKELKAAKMVGLIMGTFLILWTPFMIAVLLSSMNINPSMRFIMLFKDLHYANSAINPILYVALNEAFRTGTKRVFYKMGILRRSSGF